MTKIKHQVGIVGNIGKIFQMVSEPKGLDRWWATKADGKAEEGKVVDLYFSDVVTLSFKVVELQENVLIHLRCVSGPYPWQDCDLIFSFKQDADQVWVSLIHENEVATDDEFLYFNTKWPCYLLSLRDLIESGQGRPYPSDVKIHLGD